MPAATRRRSKRLQPIFVRFSRSTYHIGSFGDGMKMKLVANLLVAIHNVAAAEAMVLAAKSGLDLATVYKVIKDGAGQSRMFDVRGPQMVNGNYEPPTMKISVWQKDMSLITDFAADLDAPTPLFATTVPLYASAMPKASPGLTRRRSVPFSNTWPASTGRCRQRRVSVLSRGSPQSHGRFPSVGRSAADGRRRR